MEQSALVQRLSHLPLEPNPVLLEHARQRTESLNNRIADLITAFAGSMLFVYIHLLWFRLLDRVQRRGVPVWPPDDDRVAGGDLPLNLRDDQPEPSRR